MDVVFKVDYHPRRVSERMQLVHPECWSVKFYQYLAHERELAEQIKQWAHNHPMGRFITLFDYDKTTMVIEFDRAQEYTEFALTWM